MNEELKAKIEAVLGKDPYIYWREYIEVYKLIYSGANWSGCKCKATKLRRAVEDWYNANKPK